MSISNETFSSSWLCFHSHRNKSFHRNKEHYLELILVKVNPKVWVKPLCLDEEVMIYSMVVDVRISLKLFYG